MPSKERPQLWSHALNQIYELSEKCDIKIVSPVRLSISLRRHEENKERAKSLPPYEYKIRAIPCWRPIYIDFSFLPCKYRKYYFQIVSMIASLLLVIFRKRIKFDIIHAHFVYRPGYVAAVLGRIFGKPVVITAHGTDIHHNLYKENIVYKKRTIDALRRSKKIIAVSEFLKRKIANEGFGKKTCVIPCGFSESEFYPMDKKKCRTKLSLETSKKNLLFIGNLITVKGVDILIEAFKIVLDKDTNVVLIIIGEGTEKITLEQQARDCKIDKMVHFLGSKNNNEIPLYINSSDVIVLPSRDEGRGLVIFEALACGKPVVASRVGGIPETVVNDKLGILVEKENPIDLADGILKALASSWDSLYQCNYINQYCNTKLVAKVLKVYDKVLNRA